MSEIALKTILEGAIMAADHPMTVEQLMKLFDEDDLPAPIEIRQALEELSADYQDRGIELKEVASGYRFQVSQSVSPWIQKLFIEKPAKYSRAFLETLALIVYRQPITRAEIEEIRGVAVSTTIIKTLLEREWIRVIGYKEMPGKPALYATTKQFLDDFNLKSISELPPLSEIQDLAEMEQRLAMELPAAKPQVEINIDQEILETEDE